MRDSVCHYAIYVIFPVPYIGDACVYVHSALSSIQALTPRTTLSAIKNSTLPKTETHAITVHEYASCSHGPNTPRVASYHQNVCAVSTAKLSACRTMAQKKDLLDTAIAMCNRYLSVLINMYVSTAILSLLSIGHGCSCAVYLSPKWSSNLCKWVGFVRSAGFRSLHNLVWLYAHSCAMIQKRLHVQTHSMLDCMHMHA